MKKTPARLIPALLCLWVLLLLIAHAWWMATYTGGVCQEDTALLTPAVEYVRILGNQVQAFGEAKNTRDLSSFVRKVVLAPYLWSFMIYPPLPSFLIAMGLLVGGSVPNAPYLPVFLYLPLLVLGTYLLARRFCDPKEAAFAAAIVPLFPGCFFLQRQLYAAYPMTVLLTFVYWTWWRSDMLARPRWAAGFGALVGLLLLVKHTALVFLLLPAIWTPVLLVREWLGKTPDRQAPKGEARRRWLGVAVALPAFAAVASVWYIPSSRHLFFTMGFQALRGVPPFESLYYPRLVALMVGYPLSALTILTLATLVALAIARRREGAASPTAEQKRRFAFFALWILLPIVVFSFLPVINMEVTLPIMPAVAMIFTMGVFRLLKSRAAVGVLSVVALTLGVLFLSSLKVYGLPFHQQLYEPRFPGTDRSYADLLDALKEMTKDMEKPAIAFVPFADIYLADKVFGYYAQRHHYRHTSVGYWFDHLCGDLDPETPAPPPRNIAQLADQVQSDPQFRSVVAHSDIILVNERDAPMRDHERLCLLAQATGVLLRRPPLSETFTLRKEMETASGSRLLIFQRTTGKAPKAHLPPTTPPGEVGPPTPGMM